jgi:hypothetical protein
MLSSSNHRCSFFFSFVFLVLLFVFDKCLFSLCCELSGSV